MKALVNTNANSAMSHLNGKTFKVVENKNNHK